MPGRESIRSTMQSRRVLGAIAVLAIVWIGVYWATPPAPQPVAAITFDRADDAEAARGPMLVDTAPSSSAPTEIVEVPTRSESPPVTLTSDAQPAVIPPTFRERIVRPGETMESIARTEFGDASMWTVVASANPRVDPMKMRAGMTLRIPLDPTNIQGKPNPAIAKDEPPTPTTESSRIEYVVRSGDTLGGIARVYYNSAAKWRVILDANRDILSRPEQLRPGMKLVIPPAPSGD